MTFYDITMALISKRLIIVFMEVMEDADNSVPSYNISFLIGILIGIVIILPVLTIGIMNVRRSYEPKPRNNESD